MPPPASLVFARSFCWRILRPRNCMQRLWLSPPPRSSKQQPMVNSGNPQTSKNPTESQIHTYVCVSLNIDSRYSTRKKKTPVVTVNFSRGISGHPMSGSKQISEWQPDVAFWLFHDQPEPKKNLMLP